MGLWSRFKRWVSRTFGGNDGSSRTTTRASRVSNYGGGGIRSYRDYSGGGYEHEYQSYQRRRELERQERKRKQDATTNALASISKRTDSLSSGRSPSVANNGTTRVLAKIGQKATPPDPKEKARQTSQQRATAQLKKISDNRKSYNKATNDRYNVDKNGLKARQAQKSQAYDVEAEKWETKQHPVATSFARGAASGVTFGGSELLAQKSKNRQKSGAEQFYQQNKNRKAEIAGEIAGSLVGFGLTGEASAKAVGKLTPKAVKSLGARGTEKLASSAMIRKAAEKEAVKRFGVEGATKEVINQIARRRATTAMAELGKDAAINMTTGLASDLSHSYLDASKDGKFDRGEFAKSMGTNAALNTVLGGATSLVPAFRVGKHFDDGIDALKSVKASNVADDVKVSLNRRRRTDVRMPEVRPPEIIDSESNPRAIIDEVSEATAKAMDGQAIKEEAVTRERPQIIERGVVDAAGPQTLDEAVERAAVNAVERNADEVASAAKAVPNAEQAVKGTADEATEEAINRTVKTEAERREIRQTHEQLNADIQRVSDGKYGARKSYVTAADFAGDAEVDKLAEETRKVMDDLGKGDGLGDILKSDRVYTRNTREVRDKIAKEQAIKALNDPEETIKKLQAKLKNGEDFSLEDYGQMTAIKNFCNQNGIELPPDVAHDFSKVYMTSQTERAQLLRSSYLFMAENDPDFKQHLLRKDLQRFRETVCHITDKEWKEVSALLDKAKGENGWLESEIKRLSALTGAENREAFEKGYRDLCKEVYRHTEPSFWEVVSLIRHSFMLSNLKTGANNIIGNLSQLSMYRLSDMLNVAFENQIAKSAVKNGEEFRRTTALLKNNELRKLARWGSLQSGKLGEAISKNAKETEFEKLFNEEVKRRVADAMGDSKYGFDWEKGASLRHEGMGKVKGSVVKGAQKMSKAVGFMLNEPDSWFVEKSYRLAFAKYLEANGITTAEQFLKDDALIKEASDHAFDVALENTYKKANRLVNFLEGARSKGYAKHSKLYQKAIAIGLDAELPYLKVPVNLVINNFKYSPMGIVKSGANAMTALKHGDVDALNKACRELSKGLTGTGMAMVGFMLACEDQAGDDDWGFISSAKDELKEYGVRDNSLKIGNKNLSVANMGIGTVQFLMGARYAEEINDRGGAPSSFLDNFDILTSVFSANFDAVADMSLLDNAFAIFDAVSNKGEYEMKPSERFGNIGVAVAGNYAGQFVPSPVRAIARGTTSSDLDTNIKKGEGDKYTRQIRRSANNVISGIPGLNEAILPHKVDRHGNYVNERNTAGEKLAQSIRNVTDPFNTKTVKIPAADREEMKVTKKGKPYQPKGFDENRKYQAKIGAGKHAELIDLTGKEREQAARSYKNSGYDSATSVIKKGFFGDSHGARAAEILNNIPDDEEKAREYIFSTPEYQNLDNDAKSKFLDAWYGQGTGNTGKGRSRTANEEVYVNIKGGDEGDFRYQNDLHWRQQDKYENNQLADVGITKGQWADIVEAAQFESHKYKDGKNVDTINSAWKLKNALMGLDLTPEQRVAAYQAFRGKRNGFGWYDWDGASLKGYRRGRRRRGYRRYGRGGSSKKAEVPKPKTIKASSFSQGEALVSKRSSSSAKATPPTLKRVQAKIDLPNKKR